MKISLFSNQSKAWANKFLKFTHRLRGWIQQLVQLVHMETDAHKVIRASIRRKINLCPVREYVITKHSIIYQTTMEVEVWCSVLNCKAFANIAKYTCNSKKESRNKTKNDTKSKNLYQDLLLRLFNFLSRRTESSFYKTILRRLVALRTITPPVSLSKMVKQKCCCFCYRHRWHKNCWNR